MRVLVVEDSPRVMSVVSDALRAAGHAVRGAGRADEARAALLEARFDLAVVDIGLPDASGIELCREARSAGHDLPILLLTARSGVEDRVRGLDAGADDYLVKPFATSELLARTRALTRRAPRWAESTRTFGPFKIDRDRQIMTRDGARVPLTARELEIVAVLAWADGRVLSKDQLLESIWGDASAGASASLEVLLTRIRRKLSDGGAIEAIRTIRQVGYAWAIARSKGA